MYSPYLAEQNTYHSSFFLLILAATGVWSLKCYTQKKKRSIFTSVHYIMFFCISGILIQTGNHLHIFSFPVKHLKTAL